MMEDLIDFPCSADWLDYYHERGLTPRSSGRADPEIRELWREVRELVKRQMQIEEMILEILNELKVMRGTTSRNRPIKLDGLKEG